MKNILIAVFTILLAPLSLQALELDLDSKSLFDANFTIDSTFTLDGKTSQLSASGEAGPYGRVYLSYEFTSKQDLADRGEFTGYAWTQNGEDIVTASLQGFYVKKGAIYKMYTLDVASNGVFHFGIGQADFVAKTLDFKVEEINTD